MATLPVFPVVLVRPINVDVHKFAPACHADSLSCTDYPCDFLLAWNYNLLNTASIVEGPYFYTAISPASNESPAGFIKDHSCGFYRYFHTPFNSFVCVHKLEFFSPVFKPQTLTINYKELHELTFGATYIICNLNAILNLKLRYKIAKVFVASKSLCVTGLKHIEKYEEVPLWWHVHLTVENIAGLSYRIFFPCHYSLREAWTFTRLTTRPKKV